MDFGNIWQGVSGTSIGLAVIAAASVIALVLFARWGAKKVGNFFGKANGDNGHRTLAGWYSGNTQGVNQHASNYNAVGKAMDRQTRKQLGERRNYEASVSRIETKMKAAGYTVGAVSSKKS